MADEPRVFDVSKPNRISPSATSKPVIVGHHPIMNDPMVRTASQFSAQDNPAPTHIPVSENSDPVNDPAYSGPPAVYGNEADSPDQAPPDETGHSQSVGDGPFTAAEPSAAPQSEFTPPLSVEAPEPHIEGLHFTPAKHKRPWLKFTILILLVLLVGAYLAIDSGLIKTSFKLPFHIFKQKSQTASTPPAPASNPAASTPAIPAGFSDYKLSGTNLTFAAPTAWGDPTSTTDPGYSARGGTNQSDGVYAYLVNFATNKDIQIAVTSSKYLPAVRTPLYYDYLQWCLGTNDNKIYESVLNFSTSNKIDTPTTITCNQGPVAGASQLDSQTILQAKAQDSSGKVIGDIYTKNLTDPSLVVFRVKDAAMTNGTNIKELLTTIKFSAASTTSSSSSNSSAGSSNP